MKTSFFFLDKGVIVPIIGFNDYRLGVLFDRQSAIRLSGMSEKAYSRSFNSLQNGLGVKCVPFCSFYL